MYISEIKYFSKTNAEADVYISDGKFSILCYAYPISSVSINQKVACIYAFDCTDIVQSYAHIYMVNKLPSFYSYSITAELISKEKQLVRLGDILIYIDGNIPKDILVGQYISFFVSRFDLG